MCGICGQYNFGNGAPASRRTVEAMAQSIREGQSVEFQVGQGPKGKRAENVKLVK